MSAFLRFAVEKTLAGDGAKLKEYVIGTDVFGKGAEFDPRLDPVVRVEARRLRAKLQEYYEGPGQADAIRITFRKGGYAPSFDHAPPIARSPQDTGMPDPGTRKPHRGAWLWAGAALAVAGIALLVARHGPAGPVSLVVIPSAEQAEEQGFADGLAQAVAAELTHDSAWRVVAWPRFAEYRQTHGGPGSLTTGATAKDLSAGAVLTVGTRLREGRRLVFAVLMKPEQGFKDWAGEYESQQRASHRLALIVPLTVLLIAFLLYTAFGSFKWAFVILLAVTLAPFGGLLALLVTGTHFSVSSGIGFLALFGVSVQVGVIMVEYINQLRARGMSIVEAAVEGAVLRLRPIMLTMLVATLGLLPAALSHDVGSDSQRPFAIVIVGGLLMDLLLGVFLLPNLYVLLARPTDPLPVEEEGFTA